MSGHAGPAAAGPPPSAQSDNGYGPTPPEEAALGLDGLRSMPGYSDAVQQYAQLTRPSL